MATHLVTRPSVHRSVIEGRIADLEHQLAVERELLNQVTPVEPAELGSVIRFRKYNGQYTFAAIRATENAWYITQNGILRRGQQHIGAKTWTELLVFIGDRNWDSIEVLG